MNVHVPRRLHCGIQTRLQTDDTSHEVLEFETVCIAEPWMTNGPHRRKVASLKGFSYIDRRVPRSFEEDIAFDSFDSRSGNAADGFVLMVQHRKALARAASGGATSQLKGLRGVVFCQRLFVNPAVRGNRLGLRMLREVKRVFASSHTLMLLKAFPDGMAEGEMSSPRLAQYYTGDPTLGLGAVDAPGFPGWLAGQCVPHKVDPTDQLMINLKVTGSYDDCEELKLDREFDDPDLE